jgi:hypothetical protein
MKIPLKKEKKCQKKLFIELIGLKIDDNKV